MSNIVEISTGVRVSLQRIAEGSASPVTKQGAFFVFSVRAVSYTHLTLPTSDLV